MADRTVKVGLVAEVSGYVAGMKQAAAYSTYVGTEAERAAKKLQDQRQAMTDLGGGMLKFGAVAAAGIALAVVRFAEFDAAMSNVKAVTQESESNMNLLTDAALKFGASSVFTATEAANAIEELGKAGLTTADILDGGLAGSLNLASAGELEIARAAEIAATTLQQFGLAGDQASRVADTLAAGAGKALGSVDDLANGLKFVGPVAKSMGVSLEETTGVLALFAQQGIIGEQAGTSLRGMLSSLTSPSSLARKEIEALGIQLYDGQGAFLGLENAAGELQKAYGPMTDAQRDASLGVLFGNQQVTAARVLYQDGAQGVSDWTKAVSDSGYAAQVANDRLDNLTGDVEALGGAFDTYLIRSGSAANDSLRSIVQTLTFLTESVGAAPQPLLNVGMALGVVTTAVALTGGAALVAVPKYVAMKATLDTLGISAGTVAKRVLLTGGAIAGATLAIGFFVGRAAQASANTSELASSLDEATGATTKYTRELVARKLAETGAFEAAKEAGVSQKELTDAVLEGGDALDEIKAKLSANNTIATFFTGVGIRAGNASMEIKNLASSVEASGEQFENQKKATEGSAESTAEAAEAYKDAATEASTLNDNLMSLIDTVNEANGVGQDAVTQNAAYQSSLADAKEAVDEFIAANGASVGALDESTVVGSENAAMLADLASKSQAAAAAALEANGSTDEYQQTLKDGRQEIYDTALALTGNADAAQLLTDKIFAMPSAKEIKLIADTDLAASRLQRIQDLLRGIGATSTLHISTAPGRGGMTMADGGAIPGVGGPRQDNIPIMASVGEHMLDAEDVQKMGGHAGVYAFRESLYKPRGYADGGAVQYAPSNHASSSTTSGAPAEFTVVLGQKGGVDLLKYVDVQIEQNDRNQDSVRNQGSRGF